MIRRGDIHIVDFGDPDGHTPAKRRPVVIIQGDDYNRSGLGTALVVVLTGNTGIQQQPGNVLLPSTATGLKKDSVANVTALYTVNKDDLGEKVGEAPSYLMGDISAGLRLVMEL